MNWDEGTDAERLTYLTECRERGMAWTHIAHSLHIGILRLLPYRQELPRRLRRNLSRWLERDDGDRRVLHCPGCGFIVSIPGLCELCLAQREGRVFLYRELEAMHG